MVVFNEEKHTYQNPETKEFYTSVSSLLSKYKEPFDKHFHASKKALKEGVTKEEMLKNTAFWSSWKDQKIK